MQQSSKGQLIFLVNPRSGGRRTAEIIRNLKRYSEAVDSRVSIAELGSDQAINQIGDAGVDDILVIGGGDGTFSTLLPQLAETKAAIAVLPLGTGNDLARELGVYQEARLDDVSRVIKFFREAARRKIYFFKLEYGENYATNVSFINYVSFGFDAKVVNEFGLMRKHPLWSFFRGVWGNRLGYAISCLKNAGYKIVSNSSYTIKGREVSHSFNYVKSIIITNICSMMGLGKSNLHGSIYDNHIECVVVNGVMDYLTILTHHKLPMFKPTFIGSSVEWDLGDLPENVHVQIDGEPRPDINSKHFRIRLGGELSMIVGRNCQ